MSLWVLWIWAFPQSVSANNQNCLLDSPGMTSSLRLTFLTLSTHTSHCSEVPYVKKLDNISPGPISRKQTSLPWPYLAAAIVLCATVHLWQAVKGAFLQANGLLFHIAPLSDVQGLIPGSGFGRLASFCPFPEPFWSTPSLWHENRPAAFTLR